MKLKRVRSVPLHNYGLPYKGSKNKIARWVVSYLPAGGTLYDLFCGGCAVTHAAIEAKKFKHFVINDITPGLSQFFVDCIHGKYSNRTEFVSHEEFDAKKDKDLFIRLIWSFGNNLHTYLYNRDIEEFKRIVHYMLTGKTVTERRLHYRNMIEYFRTYGVERGGGDLLNKKSLSHLERLGRIENIQNLEAQGRIENIYPFCRRYNEVPISDHSGVIYCDPPYRNTTGYQRAHAPDPFNYEAFYDWCERQTVPVIISEYDMPKERFITIAEREKLVDMSSVATHYKATERLFIPNCQEKLYAARMNQPCPDTTTDPPVMPESKKESAPKREQLSLF